MARPAPKRDTTYYDTCPVIFSLNVLGKKWLVPIICELNHHGVMRFGDLLKAIDGVTNVTLAQALKDLQGLGIVSRIQYNEIPLRVEYSLTKMGLELLPSIYELGRWSECMKTETEQHTCSKEDCPAHTMHLINIKHDEISKAHLKWEDGFLRAVRELARMPAVNQMDALEQVRFVLEYTLEDAASCGEALSRLQTMYYIIGDERSEDLLRPDRPAFAVLQHLLSEAREQDILTDEMTDEQIISSFMAFRHGLLASWELERGTYDIVDRNRPAIRVFINGFRKNRA